MDYSTREKERMDAVGSMSTSRRRRSRTVFTAESIKSMEKLFEVNRYPDIHERDRLASELSIPEPRIQVWFQNRRSRTKKANSNGESCVSRQKCQGVIHQDQSLDLTNESTSEKSYPSIERSTEATPTTAHTLTVPDRHHSEEHVSHRGQNANQPLYMASDQIVNTYRDWLSLKYNLTAWQGWIPMLQNEYHQQCSPVSEARMEREDHVFEEPIETTSGLHRSENETTKEEDECIVDRLFRFSKKRQQHIAGKKRGLDEREPYTMKVPRIGKSRCSTDDFEIPEERISDGYPTSGFFAVSDV